jgi:hypothetical protein
MASAQPATSFSLFAWNCVDGLPKNVNGIPAGEVAVLTD